MTSPITDRSTVLAKAIQALLTANKTQLGLKEVLYGNQMEIPRTPAVVVMVANKVRELVGVASPGGKTHNRMAVTIDLINTKVGNEADERLAIDQLAEDVEKLLHQDVKVGGLIIHGFVNNWSPGEVVLRNGQFRTVRMTYVGMSETYLSA